MQKILINGRFLLQSVTGVQRYALEFIQALDLQLAENPSLQVSIIMPRCNSKKHTLPKLKNITYRQVGILQGPLWEQFELPFYLTDELLICLANTAPVFSLLQKNKIVVTVHDLSYRYASKSYTIIFRALYNLVMPSVMRFAYKVITVSVSERNTILKYYPFMQERLFAVPNGGLPDRFNPLLNNRTQKNIIQDKNDQAYILYVGSLSPHKNFSLVFEVACQMARSDNLNFKFVGAAPSKAGLKGKAFEIPADLTNNLEFVGQINDWQSLIKYYQNATCLLFPSIHESSGLPPIEAMACGCPVIVSTIPALIERCADAAIYCDPYDKLSLITAIEKLLSEPEKRQEIINKGCHRAHEYNWANCVKLTMDIALDK